MDGKVESSVMTSLHRMQFCLLLTTACMLSYTTTIFTCPNISTG